MRALTGADAFARVLDREVRRGGLAGFVSYALLTLDRRPDVDALRAAVAADTPLGRGLRARLRRPFPLLPPRWLVDGRAPPPRVELLDAPPPGADPWMGLAAAPLRPDRGENLRLTVFPAGDGSWRVGYLFHHLLMDARGAERALGALGRGGGPARWAGRRTLLGAAPFRRIATLAREQVKAMESVAARPLHVCGDGSAPPSGPCAGGSVLLDGAATAEAVAAGRRAAGYAMEGVWYLATLLAADRETDPRPARPGSAYVVPVPASLDRKGEGERVFGNHVVFHFLAVPVEEAVDPAASARSLRDALLQRLRDGSDLRSEAQMEFCRLLPAPLYAWTARDVLGGALGSVFFTNPGPVAPALETFLGATVTDLRHFPVPTPLPGLCGATWTFRGRLGLSVTSVPGRVDGGRAAALLARWAERVRGRP